MGQNFPPKTRTAGAMKPGLFPGKSRGAGVNEGQPSGPSARKGSPGNKPAKGVLSKGGGHG